MLRTAAAKIAWVGRTTSMVFGLALVMALVIGVASTAFGANGQNFILGKLNNAATQVAGLVGNVDGAAALRVTNPNTGANDTALDLRVQAEEAPMKVNSGTKVANLNADMVDGKSGENLAQLDPATAQNGSLHHDGMVRSGSETGTSESPATGLGAGYEGVVTRRVVSADHAAGTVIARTNELRLERDGTFGGMRIAWDGGTHNTNAVSCVYADGSSTGSALGRALPFFSPSIGGLNPGSETLFTNAEAGEPT